MQRERCDERALLHRYHRSRNEEEQSRHCGQEQPDQKNEGQPDRLRNLYLWICRLRCREAKHLEAGIREHHDQHTAGNGPYPSGHQGLTGKDAEARRTGAGGAAWQQCSYTGGQQNRQHDESNDGQQLHCCKARLQLAEPVGAEQIKQRHRNDDPGLQQA
ncbi:hypothetical protein D3C73_1123050 [compost metagenome]